MLGAWTASLGRARALASELSPSVEGNRYLAIVEAVPLDDVGVPRADDQAFRRARQPVVARIDSELAFLRDPLPTLRAAAGSRVSRPRARLHVRQSRPGTSAIDPANRSRPNPAATPVAADAPPLIAYRIGICVDVKAPRMEQVRTAVPRFVETSYFRARLEVREASRTGAPNARQLLSEAYARFPTSASVTYQFGSYNQTVGDCKQAVKYYDETLALQARHEERTARADRLPLLSETDG